MGAGELAGVLLHCCGDPAARTVLPFRTQAVDLAAGHPDRPGEFTRLPFEPPLSSEHEHRERHDDDQIDAQREEQCNQHGFWLTADAVGDVPVVGLVPPL